MGAGRKDGTRGEGTSWLGLALLTAGTWPPSPPSAAWIFLLTRCSRAIEPVRLIDGLSSSPSLSPSSPRFPFSSSPLLPFSPVFLVLRTGRWAHREELEDEGVRC